MSAFTDQFKAWANDTVLVERYLDRNEQDEPVFAGPVPYQAYIDEKPGRVLNRQGEVVTYGAVIYFLAPDIVDPNDRLTLPDSRRPQGRQPQILRIDNPRDEHGPSHQVVYT